jgi:uncharacterized protein YraI
MTRHRKTTGLAAFALAAAMGVSAGQALDAQITADAEMHIGPNTSFPVVGSVPVETGVQVNGCTATDGWCMVRHGGRHGWVSAANVRITGITRARHKFEDAIVVISVADHYRRGIHRRATEAVVPFVIQQDGMPRTSGRRVYSTDHVVEPRTGGDTSDFTVIKVR